MAEYLHTVIPVSVLKVCKPVRQFYIDLGDGGAEGYGVSGRFIGKEEAKGRGQQSANDQYHNQDQHQSRAAHQ